MAALNRFPLAALVALSLFVGLSVGCGGPQSRNDRESGAAVAVNTQQAAGDFETSKSAPPIEVQLDGKPWTTSEPGPLGDPRAVRGGTMKTNVPNWPATLRIYGKASNTFLNSIVEGMCYESLCAFHPVTLETIPQLATHWHISDDKMTFRFKLNPRARWSDGKPVTTDDVLATYDLLMDDTLIAPMTKQSIGKMQRPKVIGEGQLEVRCTEKDWRNFIAIAGMSILPAHQIAQLTGGEFLKKYNFDYPVGSGPYFVRPKDVKKGESITLTRRDDWWRDGEEATKGIYNIGRIRFVVVRDQRLAFEKACKGELDFYPVYSAKWWVEDITSLQANQQGHLIRQKIYTRHPEGFQGMAFNMRNPPLDDVRVRQALAHLYDRRSMIKEFAYDEYVPLKSYFPNSDGENPANEMVEYDAAAAQQLLAEAGWQDRDGDGYLVKDGQRLALTLLYRSQAFEKYLTTFQQSCKKAGVQINLKLVTPETHWKNMMDRKFQIAGMAWGAIIFPNPRANWGSRMADEVGSNNITGFKSEKADQIIGQYDEEFDLTKRNELLRKLDAEIFAQHPYAQDWFIPCQRVLYWNKFGMPQGGLTRYADWRGVFSTWWVDPEKERELKLARKSGAPMTPIPPLEVKYWIDAPSTDVAQARR
ncbi:MAG: extracellular solute-binding protein [Planctomycetota bacterium]|nr:extracellular solute-binding protein [Planctomycetota bacterium]